MEDFFEFLDSLPTSESIDRLSINHRDKGNRSKIADYFFLNRKIICEVKSFQKDTRHKIEEAVKRLEERDEFPVFYGRWELRKILGCFSDGSVLYEKIINAITSPVETHIKDANRQIRETKKQFNLKDGNGLVVLMNREVETLDAELIAWRVNQCLGKRNKDSSWRYENVRGVLLFDEAHVFDINEKLEGPICIHLARPGHTPDKLEEYMRYFSLQWSTWKGYPEVVLPQDQYSKNKLRSKKETPRFNKVKRHEMWRMMYAQAPYLRSLTKTEFIEYGKGMLHRLTPLFLKNGIRADRATLALAMERFTHFQEETNFRGIDMREFELSQTQIDAIIGMNPSQDSDI